VRTSEDQLVAFCRYLASALVSAPGHPEHGPFYFIKGLLKVLNEYPW
jgi:hypothetical protein